jgi:hypothetical protein
MMEHEKDLIITGIESLYKMIYKDMSQDWKTYTVTINDVTHKLNQECDPVIKSMVIKQLLKDAINTYIDRKNDEEYKDHNAFNVIERMIYSVRKEDHRFEIIKKE